VFAPELDTRIVSLIEKIVHGNCVRIDFIDYPNTSIHPCYVLLAIPIQERFWQNMIAVYSAEKPWGMHERSRLELGTSLFHRGSTNVVKSDC
jgi:hypothetical protein